MKYAIFIMAVVLGVAAAQAEGEAVERTVASATPTSDTIIDPELMNKGVWAEPYFRAPNEMPRETASSEDNPADREKNPEQYLDVLEKIPLAESSVSRAWLEHKALSED